MASSLVIQGANVAGLAGVSSFGWMYYLGFEKINVLCICAVFLVAAVGVDCTFIFCSAMKATGPDTPLDDSKNYMDLKFAASGALPEGVHFKLIEAVADHVCEALFLQDRRIEAVTVKIVKLAIAEAGEQIGITLHRERRE